ncbi:hypothetical protein [Streptomyces sp. NPDC046985]
MPVLPDAECERAGRPGVYSRVWAIPRALASGAGPRGPKGLPERR